MKKSLFVLMPIMILLIWLGYPFLLSSNWIQEVFPQANWNNFGVVGDSFGALNALFSGMALTGLAINIYLQYVHLRKLEAKEEENSNKIDKQAEAIRLTALLNYYNYEIDRCDDRMEQLKKSSPSQTMVELAKKIHSLRSERKSVFQKLNAETNQ